MGNNIIRQDSSLTEQENGHTMKIRKATRTDLNLIVRIYDEIHTAEEEGRCTTGWLRDIYPIRETAEKALERDDLFVLEENESILGTAIINQIQVDVYNSAPWEYAARDDQVCVLHTLVISPQAAGNGYGTAFVRFYEQYAADHRLPELRIDTNARNQTARKMYRQMGYREIAIVPTVFNGIPGVDLVLMEKYLTLSH